MMFQISHTRAKHRPIHELIIDEPDFFARIKSSLKTQHPFSAYEEDIAVQSGQSLAVDYMASPIEYNGINRSLWIFPDRSGRTHGQENIYHR